VEEAAPLAYWYSIHSDNGVRRKVLISWADIMLDRLSEYRTARLP
jgi:hypothetical protein